MIDELNILEYDKENIEEQLRQYFREMPEITEEQIEERKDVALDIFDLMLFFMFLVNGNMYANQYQDLDYYISMIDRRYIDIVNNRYGESDYFSEYAPDFARNVVNTTFEHSGEDYYLSQERALNIGENEANTIVNYENLKKAIDKGYKYKTWLTEQDNKVRKTHREIKPKTIPIKNYFVVGNSRMLYPHDAVNGAPKEIINCRCHLDFTNRSDNDNVLLGGDSVKNNGLHSMDGEFVEYNPNASFDFKIEYLSEELNKGISEACKKVAKYGSMDKYEYASVIDAKTGVEVDFGTSKSYNTVNSYYKFLRENLNGHYYIVHNHNTNTTLSLPDIQEMSMWENVDGIVATTNNGKISAVCSNGIKSNEYLPFKYMDKKYVKFGVDLSKESYEQEKLLVDLAVKDFAKGGMFIYE